MKSLGWFLTRVHFSTWQITETGDLENRRQAIVEFNETHRWKKRGMAVIPTMYGINFPVKYLNQAGAHALLYCDVSVPAHTTCLISRD